MNPSSTLERLESRIAPATLLNPRTVQYLDGDGDLVTIKISKGFFDDPQDAGQADFDFVPYFPGTLDPELAQREQLRVLDLRDDTVLDGTNITITAVPRSAGGDGTVSIGYIDARNIDLGAVVVRGDLGAIDAGDATLSDGGLKSLTVFSLGGEGTFTGAPDLRSDIVGPVGSIRVTGDIDEASISITGDVRGTLGSLFIGGSLVGGALADSGQIFAEGAVGKVVIGGDVLGDAGAASGVLEAAKFGSVTIGGALTGSSGPASGAVSAQTIGTVAIGGSVFGSSGEDSGQIIATFDVGTVRLGGSLTGGTNEDTGLIFAGGRLGSVTIGGNIFGGSSNATDLLTNSGYIEADRIGTLTVGGSIVAGSDGGGGVLNSGAVRAAHDIGTLTVRGSLEGNASNPVIISAMGQPGATGATDLAIRAVNILGRVFNSEILAGYSPALASFYGEPVNADAQIGSVKVGGDWVASDLIAGLATGADTSTDQFFGDAGDILIAGAGVKDDLAALSRIASIVVGGRVIGTPLDTDAFRTGFGAQHIVSMKVGGITAIPLTPGAGNDTFALGRHYPLGTTLGTANADGYDVHVYEV
jgi:hypothetical protein